uniref:Uncharacterized protein n=1 Tax=Meloidogyne javanica TaxID=6303 RepID=A0A915LZ84_MELJA
DAAFWTIFKCLNPISTLVAALSYRDPFSESFGKSFGRFFGKKPFDFGSNSDEIETADKTTLPAERKQPNPSKSSKLEMPKPPEFCTIVA